MSGSGFARRSTDAEILDDPTLSTGHYSAALRDLERVNRILSAYRPTLTFLDQASRGMTSIRLLDVGSGHGDHLRAIARWALRRGISAHLTGIDLSPSATEAARAATIGDGSVQYLTGNVFDYQPDPPPDFILSSLFTHHLSDSEVVHFLQWMESHARLGWHLSDLHRHPLAWASFQCLSRVLRLHPIVRHDGSLSVKRGFTHAEWEDLLSRAGLRGKVHLEWQLPFRYIIDRIR